MIQCFVYVLQEVLNIKTLHISIHILFITVLFSSHNKNQVSQFYLMNCITKSKFVLYWEGQLWKLNTWTDRDISKKYKTTTKDIHWFGKDITGFFESSIQEIGTEFKCLEKNIVDYS
jgi:hypothetical protein